MKPCPFLYLPVATFAAVLYTSSVPTHEAIAQERQILPLKTWDFAAELPSTDPVINPASTSTPLPDSSPANPAALPGSQPAIATWKTVEAPHIFRQSGLPDNSAGWYHRKFTLSRADRGRRIFLRLDGAATVKDVFVNGQFIGEHKGAYTASMFDLTPAVQIGKDNDLQIRISNRDSETKGMIARSTLFYVNGGMFRHSYLVKTGAVHIFPEMGSSGVYLTPTAISATSADLGVRTVVKNSLPQSAKVTVRHIVKDPAGKVVARFETSGDIGAGQTANFAATGRVLRPKLWELHQANLYAVRTELRIGNRLSDVVNERTGFRTIELRNNQFFLNGRQTQLYGVNKHEQSEYLWNAVGDDPPRQEWQMMDDMGVNMVRLAHYPHSPLEYDIADQKGLAVWAENGYAGHAWTGASAEDKVTTPDGTRQTREMVRQNWNHPSILFWSSGNETIAGPASDYAATIREEDPTHLRLVTYASEGSLPKNVDFIARNTYDGWYGGQYTGFSQLPRNAFVSETGSGEWLTHHVPYGTIRWSVDKYEPAEYSELFTEYRLQTVMKDDVANRPMFLWWNFREFYDHKFKNNRNTKGIITLAGLPKDIFYLFQSFMNPKTPVVHLNGRHFFWRQFQPDNGIKAYSNARTLQLTINGVSQGFKSNGDYRQPDLETKDRNNTTVTPGKTIENVFFWKATLQPGRNLVEVNDGLGHRDSMVIYQKDPAQPLADNPTAPIQEIRTSNSQNEAVFIDRPIEAQGPVYYDVDGQSDNTFDTLPEEAKGASWIATRRLSDPANKTDLSFRVSPGSKGVKVMVLFSVGTYPAITLKKTNAGIVGAAARFSQSLAALGFKNSAKPAVWRDHDVERTDAALWSRSMRAGETLTLPGETLDYVVLIKNASSPQR
jgi:beta-galactosidase